MHDDHDVIHQQINIKYHLIHHVLHELGLIIHLLYYLVQKVRTIYVLDQEILHEIDIFKVLQQLY